MEPLLKQLRDLTARFNRLEMRTRLIVLGTAVVLLVAGSLWSFSGAGTGYQYAFTNLGAEDSAEAAAQLKAAGVPFRLEAGGSALAVPASQVYDARLLLAASGLPRGGGVGFEIFDRGDLGVSEFTQRVNLRRALEGELSRTVGRLSAIRSARVHITLPEKALYRDDDRKAAAAVVVNMQPGRALNDREVQGIRHLVASAVTGLDPDSVTIVDGRGAVLAGKDSANARAISEQRETEKAMESRVSELLEAAVGPGAVVTKVTATLDMSEVESTSDAFDPDSSVARSERRTVEKTSQGADVPVGVAGAAANQPLSPVAGSSTGTGRGATSREDEVHNYEISKTTTRSVVRVPRVKKLSVAVLVDGVNGAPRPAVELARLAELAKSAVGFDPARGDRFDISSAPFQRGEDKSAAPSGFWEVPNVRYGAIAVAAFLVLFGLLALSSRRRGLRRASSGMALLKPGTRVSEIEAAMNRSDGVSLPGAAPLPALADPNVGVRDRARHAATEDPMRAAHVLKSWIDADYEKREVQSGRAR